MENFLDQAVQEIAKLRQLAKGSGRQLPISALAPSAQIEFIKAFVRNFLGEEGWSQFCRQIWETEIKPGLDIRYGSLQAQAPVSGQLPLPAPAPKQFKGSRRPARGIHPLEFPPPLAAAELAYTPPKLRSIPRIHEAIALRRELVAEALKKQKVVSGAEIMAHLRKASFPVDSAYYQKEMYPGHPRILVSLNNDLVYFARRKWVRKLGQDKWHWLRTVTPAKH